MESNEFEAIVDDVIRRLPDWVHDAMHNIQVQVMDEPDEHMDPEGEGLLGLYTGTPLTERDTGYAWQLPDVIYIFRLPHLALGLPPEQLREEIAKTTLHELAHYFGIDDAHLEDIGWG